MIEDIKGRIKNLPPLPKNCQKILDICASDEYGVGDLAKAIESDPMMTAAILKAANSPLYGLNRQIKAVSQGVALFGKAMTKSIVMGSAVLGLFKVNIDPYGIKPEEFVNISNEQAALVRAWFRKVSPPKADDLFLCALLQHTGKILLADEVVRRNDVMFFKNDIELSFNEAQVEMTNFGTTNVLVSAEIFEFWGFEPSLVESIRASNDPQNAPEEYKQSAWALFIVRAMINQKQRLSEQSVQLGLNLCEQAGFDPQILADAVASLKQNLG